MVSERSTNIPSKERRYFDALWKIATTLAPSESAAHILIGIAQDAITGEQSPDETTTKRYRMDLGQEPNTGDLCVDAVEDPSGEWVRFSEKSEP